MEGNLVPSFFESIVMTSLFSSAFVLDHHKLAGSGSKPHHPASSAKSFIISFHCSAHIKKHI